MYTYIYIYTYTYIYIYICIYMYISENNKGHTVSNVTKLTRTTTYIRNHEYNVCVN